MHNSLPTVDQANLQQFWNVIRSLDPELYLIKVALHETKVNPIIIPKIVRALANLAYGTGHGKIQIFMQDGVITQIKPEESSIVNVETIKIEEEVRVG